MYGVETYFSKRNILNRMKKIAALNFGIKDLSSLDPFVSLFLASLSEEIYKITGDIEKMEGRILEKLSDMLIWDISLYPMPSHAILHAAPIEPFCTIAKDTSFTFGKSSSDKNTDLTFHSVCNTRIVNGDICYMIIDGLCYSVDGDQTKTLLSRSHTDRNELSLWVGLKLDNSIDNLKDLSFYLNFSDIEAKEEYQKQLQYFNWKFKSQSLTLQQGLSVQENKQDIPAIELFNTLDADYQIGKSVLAKYEHNYFIIEDDISISDNDREYFPKELSSSFSEQFISDCNQPLIWIEIEYPDTINKEILSSLQVSINTFPIINKSLKSTIVDLDKFNPVIPLETKDGEHFLSIQSVTDEAGCKYHELPYKGDDNTEEYKTYSLRRGGYEKYNFRDAWEYLIDIYDLLDKYSVSLSGDDIEGDDELEDLQTRLAELLKYLRHIITAKKEINEQKTYLQIDNVGSEKILFIKYWITNTERGNNIKPGIILNNNSDNPLIQSTLALLSGTTGGRNAPLSDNRKNIYQESLVKNNLLVTIEDIEEFCKEQLGTVLESVKIKKGLITDPYYTDRFMQTIDIHLSINNMFSNILKERDQEIFVQKIKKKSPATYNYRLFIN